MDLRAFEGRVSAVCVVCVVDLCHAFGGRGSAVLDVGRLAGRPRHKVPWASPNAVGPCPIPLGRNRPSPTGRTTLDRNPSYAPGLKEPGKYGLAREA